jgi:hypothetical protein
LLLFELRCLQPSVEVLYYKGLYFIINVCLLEQYSPSGTSPAHFIYNKISKKGRYTVAGYTSLARRPYIGTSSSILCKPFSIQSRLESSARRCFLSTKESVLNKALYKYDNPIDLSSEKLTKSRRIKSLKVICTETKEENSYSTIRDAAKALKVEKNLLRDYIQSYGENNSNILFKDKYLIIVIRLKSRLFSVDVHSLPLNKWFVFHEDKKTIAFVFDSIVDACRTLTPVRCKNLSDTDLTKNKNIQYILRVINKGVVTNTEVGKFYLFKNPEYSKCLSLVIFGQNLYSTVGVKQISPEERGMVKPPYLQLGVFVGLFLSDGSFRISKRGVNYYLTFTQSLEKSNYV